MVCVSLTKIRKFLLLKFQGKIKNILRCYYSPPNGDSENILRCYYSPPNGDSENLSAFLRSKIMENLFQKKSSFIKGILTLIV